MAGLNLRLVVCSTTCRTKSGSQVIPNMALTATIIKVTRFRTCNTPCVKKYKTKLQVILKFPGAKNILLSVKRPLTDWDWFNSSVKKLLKLWWLDWIFKGKTSKFNYVAIKKIWKSDHHSCIR